MVWWSSKHVEKMAQPLALSAHFSAKHPIHVILSVLFLSTFAYVSVIQRYLNDSSLLSSLNALSMTPGSHANGDTLKYCSHYYNNNNRDNDNQWEHLNYDQTVALLSSENFSNLKHYYLYQLEFVNNNSVQLPSLRNTIYQANNTKYVLIEDSEVDNNKNNLNIIKQKNGIKWRLYDNNRMPSTHPISGNNILGQRLSFHAIQEHSKHSIKHIYHLLSNKFQKTESFDILIISMAYLSMFYTIVNLYNDMKRIGSKFWLTFSTLINLTCSFFLALYLSQCILERNVSILNLLQGIPFIIIIIGFRHQINLATLVLRDNNNNDTVFNKENHNDSIIYDSMLVEGAKLLQDKLLCLTAFIGCIIYANNLPTLTNFCILCSLLLIFELILSSTFFPAILSLKLEINSINRLTIIKQTLEEDGVTPMTANLIYNENRKKHSLNNINSNSFFQSQSTVLLAKISIIMLFIVVVFFNFGLHSITSLYNYLIFDDYDNNNNYNNGNIIISQSENLWNSFEQNLPKFIHTTQTSLLKDPVIISIVPTKYYKESKSYNNISDSCIDILHHISAIIRDRFASKVIFVCLIISASINIYLLNAAKVHTSYIVSEFIKKKNELFKQINEETSNSNEAKIDTFTPPIDAKQSKKHGKNKNQRKKPNVTIPKNEDNKIQEIGKDTQYVENVIERPLEIIESIMKEGNTQTLTNSEITTLVTNNKLPLYALEKQLKDTTRAVLIRRKALAVLSKSPVLNTERLPYQHYDYDRVFGACCENVIGYMPLPVGIIGPLIIDGVPYHIPMATTEGCLVASAMRGCKAINAGGGAETVLTKDGMTRGPCVSFPTLKRAGACKIWLDSEEGQNKIKKAFNSTSRFARLQHIQTALAGDLLFIRFRTTTGDAMGMNMISKGVEYSLKQMIEEFGWDDMEVVSVSGNYCTDKKPAAINWIEGRGKSVVAEATIPAETVRKVLKSDVKALVELNISKNLVGSAMAGAMGGFNAHAANLLTAVFLALGQDPAQNVESSNCITLMKEVDGDLRISVSMPCIEVGTIGGGTVLEPQGAMLDLLGVRGPHPTSPGDNARQLAKIVACAVMAGELSLCSALAAGHLVQSHMTHNRAKAPAKAAAAAITTGARTNPTVATGPIVPGEDLKRLQEGAQTCIKS